MPSEFALPSSVVGDLVCRFDHHRYIWEHWVRPCMLRVGARPPPTPEYRHRLTAWDMKGLLLKNDFEAWKAENDFDFSVHDRLLVNFCESNLPTLLEKNHEELSEIFARWDMLLNMLLGRML
jgi:hypothetical protein